MQEQVCVRWLGNRSFPEQCFQIPDPIFLPQIQARKNASVLPVSNWWFQFFGPKMLQVVRRLPGATCSRNNFSHQDPSGSIRTNRLSASLAACAMQATTTDMLLRSKTKTANVQLDFLSLSYGQLLCAFSGKKCSSCLSLGYSQSCFKFALLAVSPSVRGTLQRAQAWTLLGVIFCRRGSPWSVLGHSLV